MSGQPHKVEAKPRPNLLKRGTVDSQATFFRTGQTLSKHAKDHNAGNNSSRTTTRSILTRIYNLSFQICRTFSYKKLMDRWEKEYLLRNRERTLRKRLLLNLSLDRNRTRNEKKLNEFWKTLTSTSCSYKNSVSTATHNQRSDQRQQLFKRKLLLSKQDVGVKLRLQTRLLIVFSVRLQTFAINVARQLT